ncbi:dodecin family protein [Elongatibacter sediminis]|uniref:Dodecin family protein n=1 Tax=Elongatibacter sediminis TaxID=3119006 RepID=A0AAW9R674_9GAMM
MSVAKVTEISSASTQSFEDAITRGIQRASRTVHGIQSAWVNEQSVVVNDNQVTEWRVNLKVTFLLDE